MLVLTRKINEAIQIDDEIEVKIIAIEGDQIKLGISAPKEVEVHRKEIYEAIQAENNEAANASTDFIKFMKNFNKKS